MTTIKNRTEARRWQETWDAQAPRISDPAPDFMLKSIDGDETVTLSNFQGRRPVALVFGSYT